MVKNLQIQIKNDKKELKKFINKKFLNLVKTKKKNQKLKFNLLALRIALKKTEINEYISKKHFLTQKKY